MIALEIGVIFIFSQQYEVNNPQLHRGKTGENCHINSELDIVILCYKMKSGDINVSYENGERSS